MDILLQQNGLPPIRPVLTRLAVFLSLGLAIGFGTPGIAEEGEQDEQQATADEGTDRKDDSAEDSGEKLSFTDEDLKKYHRKKPDDEADEAVLAGIDGDAKPDPPRAAQGAPLVRTPVTIATPPADDPLKEYRDREAREKFRAQQLETLRTRIADLEKRLAYLNEKRLAIIDPLRVMPQARSADETVRDADLGSNELLGAVEAEIASTEESLQAARDNLVTIQTRFGAEGR